MAAATITCELCKGTVHVQLRTHRHEQSGIMLLRLVDLAPLRAHMAECSGVEPLALPAPARWRQEVAKWVSDFLDVHGFVAKGGSRACTLCGVVGTSCMDKLRAGRGACCDGCANGNTHPAPGEAQGQCAVWASEHGAQD